MNNGTLDTLITYYNVAIFGYFGSPAAANRIDWGNRAIYLTLPL